MQGLKEKEKRQLELAYLTARWAKAEKMPSYEDIFGKQTQAKPKKTAEDMFEVVKALHAKFGGA